ncbi:hypothetical protein DCO58_02995 [Helicobacter saguini]|uniref:Uncharacterized protein n=1 Tax=Helicobacter saguini TaxID=1548018 RepID=A0A347VS44_9HELI|nr:hypothetical protein [Helicobacter saguini]MWV62657.1 hypothetical protein [Helicobacter saguini]MWV66671.1 hypothetical protein [Helicobacter saguini]MWV69021.1 hypothetical protein [Helicobacter saguini]MWV71425.1 hypothetical protein [Helicobacter saguini]TLD94075.1 hypothetical protein LS64_007100 [Helicobacter saguini]
MFRDFENIESSNLDSKSKAFLSIDIAFALVIMSLGFVILLYVQSDIAKVLQNNDIQKISESNLSLKQILNTKGQTQTLTTQSGRQVAVEFFTTNTNEITLHYYKVLD